MVAFGTMDTAWQFLQNLNSSGASEVSRFKELFAVLVDANGDTANRDKAALRLPRFMRLFETSVVADTFSGLFINSSQLQLFLQKFDHPSMITRLIETPGVCNTNALNYLRQPLNPLITGKFRESSDSTSANMDYRDARLQFNTMSRHGDFDGFFQRFILALVRMDRRGQRVYWENVHIKAYADREGDVR